MVILLVPLCYVGLGVTVILLVPLCYVDLGVTVINRAFVLSVIGAGYDTLPQSVHANRNYMCEVIMMQAVTSAGTGASAGEQNWNLGIEIFWGYLQVMCVYIYIYNVIINHVKNEGRSYVCAGWVKQFWTAPCTQQSELHVTLHTTFWTARYPAHNTINDVRYMQYNG